MDYQPFLASHSLIYCWGAATLLKSHCFTRGRSGWGGGNEWAAGAMSWSETPAMDTAFISSLGHNSFTDGTGRGGWGRGDGGRLYLTWKSVRLLFP